jgi:4-aminobutyrate aminotransferase-like enzyme
MDGKTVRAKHKQLLFPCVGNYYEEPLVPVRASGLTVTDADGREYLDFFGGILTVSLGHCHPKVTARIAEQAATLGHVSTLYPTENIVALAEKMTALSGLDRCFFTSTGTEADETAVLLARIHTGGHEVIALRHSYSGRSLLAINMTGHASWRLVPSLVPGIKHALAPYCYRCPLGKTYPSCEVACAKDLTELIATETSGRPAAFIAEPILGVGGFITPPKEYFQIAAEIVKKAGALYISDEVQTGFGRTGTHWNGIDHSGVRPDIMTYAKGIANGMPMAVTVASEAVATSWKGPSIATFGGNPVSSAAALATLEVMETERIPERAARLGARLRGRLDGMMEKHRLIGDVRGMGLMQALELVKDRTTKEPDAAATNRLMEATKKRGLLVGKGGLYGNTIRMAPPMLVTESQIDTAMDLLDAALGECAGQHTHTAASGLGEI